MTRTAWPWAVDHHRAALAASWPWPARPDRCVGDRHYPSGETAQLVNGVLHRCRYCPAEFVIENHAIATVGEGS